MVNDYALVNDATLIVENVIVWDGNSTTFTPESGLTAYILDANHICAPGYTKNGSVYEPSSVASTELMAEFRSKRNLLLTASDWTQLPDAPTTNAAAWKVYRQALRDLPQRTVYPNAPTWPTAP